MRQAILLTLLGIVSYAFSLLITLPMSLALDWSGALPADVTPYGVEGSITDGNADTLIWQNWRFDHVQWRFDPLQLLSARIGYHLGFTNPDGSGAANAGIGLGDSIHLDQLTLRLPLRWLSRQWSFSTRFGGELAAELSEFAIEDGRISAASGTLLWSGAQLRGDPPTTLGAFRAQLQAVEQDDGSHYRGPISDNGGPLSASGQFDLSPDGHWQIGGKLALRDAGKPADKPALAQLFNSLGRAGADGKVDFKLQGRLPLPQSHSSAAAASGQASDDQQK